MSNIDFASAHADDNPVGGREDLLALQYETGASRKPLTGTDTVSWHDKAWVVGITASVACTTAGVACTTAAVALSMPAFCA